MTDSGERADVIGSAWRWTSLHAPFSRRKMLVTRRATGVWSLRPPILALRCSISTHHPGHDQGVGTSQAARSVSSVMTARGIAGTLLALAVSCTGARTEATAPTSSSGASGPSPALSPSVQPVTDFSSFTHALGAAGFDVRHGGGAGFPGKLLGVPGRHVLIDEVPVSVFQYPTERALDKARSSISPRGDQIPTGDGGLAIIEWEAPRFYASGRLLILYFGDKERTREALEMLLGRQFAGG
jgi:hypothetical protein